MVVRGMILAHSFPVARAERPLVFNQDLKAVVTRDDIDSNFILHWLMSSEQQLRSLATEIVSLMDRHVPQWRHHRKALNEEPLGHADWSY